MTTIHHSCAVLLATLAVGGCQLGQLPDSLACFHEGWSSRGRLLQWMEHLDWGNFGLVVPSPVTVTGQGDFMALVSLPYPEWKLLLKVLL